MKSSVWAPRVFGARDSTDCAPNGTGPQADGSTVGWRRAYDARVRVRSAASALDHLLIGAPDLDVAIDWFLRSTGVRATRGGRHDGLGTWNAVVPIGDRRYVELIAPDPEQPQAETFYVPGLRAFDSPRLARWSVTPPEGGGEAFLDQLGPTRRGSRTRPDGARLEWTTAFPTADGLDSDPTFPFVIAWGGDEHPGAVGSGVRLVELSFGHPSPATLRAALGGLGIDAVVAPAIRPLMTAIFECPRGVLRLSS
jgi:hypothetical protein